MWVIAELGVSSKTCLLPMITDATQSYFKLYHHYKNGVLVESGGLYDQPSKYLEIVEALDGRLVEASSGDS